MYFRKTEIHNLLNLFAEISGLNIITSDAVKGRVSLKLRNVPWDQAFDIVLKTLKLGQEKRATSSASPPSMNCAKNPNNDNAFCALACLRNPRNFPPDPRQLCPSPRHGSTSPKRPQPQRTSHHRHAHQRPCRQGLCPFSSARRRTCSQS